MHSEEDYCYHVYNRSKETIFFERDNYLFFLEKIRKQLFPFCEILAWCLMPNHFHFMIIANKEGCLLTGEKHRPNVQILSKNLGTIFSSYTRAINKMTSQKGRLFAHNTTAKQLNFKGEFYARNCFQYIHQNPKLHGLVKKMENWEFSSFRDYIGLRNGTLINQALAREIVNFDNENFYEQSYIILSDKDIDDIH